MSSPNDWNKQIIEERDRVFANVVKQAPGYGEYQQNNPRIIPVVILKRV